MQQGELKCIACGYDLREQSAGGVCPECGEAALHAVIGARDPALFKRESRMLRKQDIYRRNRNGSIFLAVGGILSLLFVMVLPALGVARGPLIDGLAILLASSLANAVFWSAMAYAFHARLMHCRSIRTYRYLVNRRFGKGASSSD